MSRTLTKAVAISRHCRALRSSNKHVFRFITPSLFVPTERFCQQSKINLLNFQHKCWNSTISHQSDEILQDQVLGDCPGCGAPFQKSSPHKPGYLVDRLANSSRKQKKTQNKSFSDKDYQTALEELDPETRALLEGPELEQQASAGSEETQKPDRAICQRCYALQHYNVPTTESGPDFLRASQQYGSLEFLKTKRDPLVVAVLDVSDMPASLGHLPELLAENPGARVMIAANKIDILPASARRHEQRIRDWIVHHVKSLGLPTQQISSVTLISAKKGWGIPTLMRKMDRERRPTDDIYLVGCTNVGKSALVNQFMSQIRGTLDSAGRQLKAQLKLKYKITSSAVPGTTMGTIRVPLHALGMSDHSEGWEKKRFVTRERYIVDTPGIINDQQLIHLLPYDEQKRIVSQKEFNPVTFKLEPGKSLVLKPLVRIDLLESSNPVLFTIFSPLAPHLTRTEKLPAAQALEPSHARLIKDERVVKMDLLKPLDEIIRVRGIHPSHASVDFSFAGVGWVSLTGEFERAKFRLWLPRNVDPYQVFKLRDPPFLPYEYKGSIRKFFGSGERTRR